MTPGLFAAYTARGFALCRIPAGRKNPVEPLWQLNPLTEAAAFRATDAVGLLLGPLSGDVLACDLDFHAEDADAWAAADELLPTTGLMDGRPGKLTAHRIFRITDRVWPDSVLPGPASTTRQAMDQGILPRFAGSRRFSNGQGRGLDLLGAGAQIVIPPSRHPSGVDRVWWGDEPGTPTPISYADLLAAVHALVDRLGLRRQPPQVPEDMPPPPDPALLAQVPEPERLARLEAYLQASPPLAHGQGQGFHAQQWRMACVCAEFGVPMAAAAPLYLGWNQASATPDPDPVNQATLASAYRTAVYGARVVDAGPPVDLSGICGASAPGSAPPTPTALTFDLQTFAETPARDIAWIWPGVLPRGMLALLGGKQGLGKSFLICDLAARISTGQPMPDGTILPPGKVLLLAREDDASCVLLPRLRAARADLSRIAWSIFANAATGSPLDLAAHINLLIAATTEHAFDLIVVDTFAAFAPAGTDANAAQDVRHLLDALTRLARATSAAVMVVAHLRKTGQGDGDPMDAIAGSAQMTAGVRVAALLDAGMGDERWFRVVKSNLGRIDPRGWTWRFHWGDPFTEGVTEVPRIVWSDAGEAYEGHEPGKPDTAPDAAAIRAALLTVLAKGPRSQASAYDLVCATLRAEQPHLKKADVELVMEALAEEGGLETWDGPRGAKLVGVAGSRPASSEERAFRMARENPHLTSRELCALAGCRNEVACEALRMSRKSTQSEDA